MMLYEAAEKLKLDRRQVNLNSVDSHLSRTQIDRQVAMLKRSCVRSVGCAAGVPQSRTDASQ